MVAIRFQDIECSRRSIRIPNTKSYLSLIVFMDPLTFAVSEPLPGRERQTLFHAVEHVFLAFQRKAQVNSLSVNAVQKMVYYYAEKCSLSHLHAHLFRHTGITLLVQEGMSEPSILYMVSHRNPDSLSLYFYLCD